MFLAVSLLQLQCQKLSLWLVYGLLYIFHFFVILCTWKVVQMKIDCEQTARKFNHVSVKVKLQHLSHKQVLPVNRGLRFYACFI